MTQPISRRALLRGLGVSIALPFMPSLVSAAAESVSSPIRMGFVFVPNGMNLHDWTPRRTGFGYDLPKTLEPLSDVREKVNVLSGLTHDKGRANDDGPGDHARSASVFLTGAQPRKTSGSNIRSGVSVDQVAAQKIGSATRFASLELGCEQGRGAGNCDSGYSCAYSSNISWSSETAPVGKETNPRLVFERLFSGSRRGSVDSNIARRQATKKSILDFVTEDARQLQKQLGGNDGRKLDEYLTGVREIERRIELAESESTVASSLDYEKPSGVPRDYGEHLRLMCDMMVLAFQTDSTRVASFMFANAGSNRNYRNVQVSEGHHELSHHGGNGDKLAKISRINRFHVAQLAYLLKRLDSISEGQGTLLDHTMICFGSAISDGNRHNNENLPILLAGGGGGSIDTGRHIRYREETPLCNLFMSMLDRVGASVDYIGDSTDRLTDLRV